jgi:DNA-binding YbaB/EbfC family protein
MKNMQQMMKQAQKMQEQMQKQLEQTVVEGDAGGGMVSVKMNGNKELLSVHIEPDVVNGDDKEMLEDLIVAAFRAAAKNVDEVVAGQLGNMASGLKMPGLF